MAIKLPYDSYQITMTRSGDAHDMSMVWGDAPGGSGGSASAPPAQEGSYGGGVTTPGGSYPLPGGSYAQAAHSGVAKGLMGYTLNPKPYTLNPYILHPKT